jgi:hypothetical protein
MVVLQKSCEDAEEVDDDDALNRDEVVSLENPQNLPPAVTAEGSFSIKATPKPPRVIILGLRLGCSDAIPRNSSQLISRNFNSRNFSQLNPTRLLANISRATSRN